jgi:hypothetical protein
MTVARRYLDASAASEYLKENFGIRASVPTLDTWATRGGGPPFHKDGRFRSYPVAELDTWAAKRLGPLVTSTAELAA